MIKLCIICNIYLPVIRNFLLFRINGFNWEFYFPIAISIHKHFAATNTGVTIQQNLKFIYQNYYLLFP